MRRAVLIIIAATALSGCVSVSQTKYGVEDGLTTMTSRTVLSGVKMATVNAEASAKQHCDGHGKRMVVVGRTSEGNLLGARTKISFRCE